MKFDIIATIEVDTQKYEYSLKDNGTRDISKYPSEEKVKFMFDSYALGEIILRTGSSRLIVDDKSMYFNYKNNELVGIHFENDKFIWIVKDYKSFLDECRRAYLLQNFACLMVDDTESVMKGNSDESNEYFDEFDVDVVDEEEEWEDA